jgi:hypothetical protein
LNEDRQLVRQVKIAFEEFAGQKVRNKVIEMAVRNAQNIREASPALSIEEVIDQAILKTVKDGAAF